jgi:protein-L-isoaspartate(D-aspartate) O-methyltransferase
VTEAAAPSLTAGQLRSRLADALIADAAITTPRLEAAVRTVPREAFVPAGVDLTTAYADDVVRTKWAPDGSVTSSISAPWLQCRMIEQAGLQPGHRVLEIGSGGYNAALIAEVVGKAGSVTTIDIDQEVVCRAREGLARSGYDRVQAVVADGEYGYPPNAPYDAIIVTVEASDVPPAWTEQLAPDGTLVIPLRMRGNTRSLALIRCGDRLDATSAFLCGFVPMQGVGDDPEQRIPLDRDVVVLRVDDDSTQVNRAALSAALDRPRVEAWSPVTAPPGVSFESLLLWLASQPVAYGRLFVDRDRAPDQVKPFAPVAPAFLAEDSLAYLALRRLDEQTWQFGAHGFGPHADPLATAMLDAIEVWDRQHRHGSEPEFTAYPAGTGPADTGRTRLVVRRRHTTIVVTWPAASGLTS